MINWRERLLCGDKALDVKTEQVVKFSSQGLVTDLLSPAFTFFG